jgi:phospholipid/cholesterol/gamma-HCH transport system substrate-binding protein
VNDAVTKFKSEGVDHLIQASQRIARITEQLESGSGIAHQLIYSGTFSNQLSTASEALATLLKEVQTGKGLLHTLFYGSEGSLPLSSLSQTVASLEETSKMIRSIVHEVQHGKGVLHHLVYGDGEASLDGLMQQLTETTSSLKVAADALAGGKGTLGALLIDPSLYDNLVEVTDDAKRSFLLREALKHSLKK